MSYRIGAWYFGGWVIGEPGVTWRPDPWAANNTTNNIYLGDPQFADRKPLIGYYNEAEQWVADWSINAAADHGIDFFGCCVYWSGAAPYHHVPIENLLRSRFAHRMKFAFLYCNHAPDQSSHSASRAKFRAFISDAIWRYWRFPHARMQEGKPVLIIFDTDNGFMKAAGVWSVYAAGNYRGFWAASKAYAVDDVARDAANSLGGGANAFWRCTAAHTSTGSQANHAGSWALVKASFSMAEYEAAMRAELDAARALAIAAGLPGIYFGACTEPNTFWVGTYNGAPKRLAAGGFDFITAYRITKGWSAQSLQYETGTQDPLLPTTYAENMETHRRTWDWMLGPSQSTIPYWLPLGAGSDKRAWMAPADRWPTSTTNNAQFNSILPTPAEFRAHLEEARARLDANPARSDSTAIVYAWNEIGEGGWVQPCARWGFDLLRAMKETFRKTRAPARRAFSDSRGDGEVILSEDLSNLMTEGGESLAE